MKGEEFFGSISEEFEKYPDIHVHVHGQKHFFFQVRNSFSLHIVKDAIAND